MNNLIQSYKINVLFTDLNNLLSYRSPFLLFITFSISLATTYGQVTGRIVDENNSGIPFATIGFFKDQKLIIGEICDSIGQFSSSIDSGLFNIQISAIGYAKLNDSIYLSGSDPLTFRMSSEAIKLEQISIEATKPTIQLEVDRVVFNVQSSIFKNGFDALELLKNTPRIIVSENGSINLQGKDKVGIMVNGRLLQMSESDLSIRLKNMKSENLERIEVIPIPPAKYSAVGNSGLVNIVLKKDHSKGVKFNLGSSYIQRERPSLGLSMGMDLQFEKLQASIGGNINRNKISNYRYDKYNFKSANLSSIIIDNETHSDSKLMGINSSLKYDVRKNVTSGITFNYNHTTTRTENLNIQKYYNEHDSSLDSLLNSNIDRSLNPKVISLTSFTDINLREQRKINISYSYFSSKNINKDVITSKIGNTMNGDEDHFQSNAEIGYGIHSFFVDIIAPISPYSFEFGTSYNRIHNNADILYEGLQINEEGPNLSNSFNYFEDIYAAYSSVQTNISKLFTLKAGLRYEYIGRNGSSDNLNVDLGNYGNLFPSLFITFNKNTKHKLSIGYSKRILRPSFNYLNPFRYYYSSNNSSLGNPFLNSSLIHNIELNYHRKHLNAIIYGSRNTNGYSYLTTFSNKGISESKPINIFNENRLGTTINLNINPIPSWKIQSSINLFITEIKSDNVEIISGYNSWGGTFNIANTFTLNKKKTIFSQIRYNHYLPTTNRLYDYNTYGYFTANTRFSLFNDKLSLLISFLDIFKQNKTTSTLETNEYNQVLKFDPRVRNIYISVNYKFGNEKVHKSYRAEKNIEKYRAN